MGEKQDVVVVGAGVFGLCAALAFLRAGRKVMLIDKADKPGVGASGGLVGALSPYMPENWNIRKAAQLRALSSAPKFWRDVAEIGGTDPHYAQTGRWIPLCTAREAELAPIRASSAATLWGASGAWHVPKTVPDCLNPDAAPFGVVYETLCARIDPRRACAALAAAFIARCGIFTGGIEVESYLPGVVETNTGAIKAKLIILATGAEQWVGAPPMRGVKGQAALLDGGLPPETPSIYADGIFIIAHGDGRVAVGSTTEESFTDPSTTDAKLDALIMRAANICPALKNHQVVERWAGLRPRAPTPEPMIGWLADGILLATGGFRTGLAMAPLLAEALLAMAQGETPDVPHHYFIADHLKPR